MAAALATRAGQRAAPRRVQYEIVRTPCAVPSRHTAAFWCANTPTVTTPGH